jgi:hypothetical protein
MAELRSVSSRADITATRFVNEYNWGNFKGDPTDWIRRYFDAFVYTANWCSCEFILRVPLDCFSAKTAQDFQIAWFRIEQTETHWVIDWLLDESENYDRFADEEGGNWMGQLVPLRDELLRGDLRPLYLGWLSCIHELAVDEPEPPIPAGLGELSAAQTALVEFLEMDVDFLNAAATASPALSDNSSNADQRAWLDTISTNKAKQLLGLLLEGRGQEAERQLKSEFFAWQREQSNPPKEPSKPRTVSELQKLADIAKQERKEREAIAAKKAAAEKQCQRDAQLRTMYADAELMWASVDTKAQRTTAASYDEVTRIIKELAAAYKLAGDSEGFKNPFTAFINVHGKRKALVDRLKKEKLL